MDPVRPSVARSTPTQSCAQLRTAVRRERLDLVDRLQVSLEPRADIVFVLAAGISSREGLVLLPCRTAFRGREASIRLRRHRSSRTKEDIARGGGRRML
jgi:hypothetical protein